VTTPQQQHADLAVRTGIVLAATAFRQTVEKSNLHTHQATHTESDTSTAAVL
jgi:hypothetical protein